MGREETYKLGASGLMVPEGLVGATAPKPRAVSHMAGEFAPPVPESFLRDLDGFSEHETGLAGQFRPWWNRDLGLWHVQILLAGGDWTNVLVVQDHERSAVTGNPREYRPLDKRVIDDLVEASKRRAWNTGDPKRDDKLYRHARKRYLEDVEEQKHKAAVERILSIGKDNVGQFARIESQFHYGHHHGARKFYPTS